MYELAVAVLSSQILQISQVHTLFLFLQTHMSKRIHAYLHIKSEIKAVGLSITLIYVVLL